MSLRRSTLAPTALQGTLPTTMWATTRCYLAVAPVRALAQVLALPRPSSLGRPLRQAVAALQRLRRPLLVPLRMQLLPLQRPRLAPHVRAPLPASAPVLAVLHAGRVLLQLCQPCWCSRLVCLFADNACPLLQPTGSTSCTRSCLTRHETPLPSDLRPSRRRTASSSTSPTKPHGASLCVGERQRRTAVSAHCLPTTPRSGCPARCIVYQVGSHHHPRACSVGRREDHQACRCRRRRRRRQVPRRVHLLQVSFPHLCRQVARG